MRRPTVELAMLTGLALLVCGCASEKYVRQSTQVVADHVASLKGDIARFAQGHEATAARRIDAVTRQRRLIEQGTDELAQQLKRQGARSLFDDTVDEATRRIDAERARIERAAAERKELRDGQVKVDTESVQRLDALTAQLKELTTQPGYKDRAKFLVDYFTRTKKEVDKLNEDAQKAEQEAKQPK